MNEEQTRLIGRNLDGGVGFGCWGGSFVMNETCTHCDGDGLSTGPPECRECWHCDGEGKVDPLRDTLRKIYYTFKPMKETKVWGDAKTVVCVSWSHANGYMEWMIRDNAISMEWHRTS